MVKEKEGGDDEKMVQVPEASLTKLQEQMAEMERKDAEKDAKLAGLEELLAKGATPEGAPALREKKNFEPKFRTVRIRKYPIAGGPDLGYVIGWTSRGAYQMIDKSGISPQVIDYIDIIFLGQEKTKDGKIKAEQVKLLDLLNKGSQVHCKVIDMKHEKKKIPTGEEIDVTVFDPQHGLIATGDKIDGFIVQSEIEYTIQIPGIEKPVVIDSAFLN
jgi:hypothetical protein